MRKLYRFCIFILTLLCLGINAMAQSGILYNGDQRLSSSFVQNVYQDYQGFIWVSTDNGLNRYDGYTFLTFNEDDGLPSANINCVMENSANDLYAGTSTGLYVKIRGHFQPVVWEGTEEPTFGFVTCFCKLPDNSLIVGTSGHGIWKLTGQTTATPISESLPELQFSRSIQVDKKGVIWVATEHNGVKMVKSVNVKGKEQLKVVKTFLMSDNLNLPVLCIDKKENIYVGSFSGGLYTITPQRDKVVLIAGTEKLPISSFHLRDDDDIFIGTNGYGLKAYNPKTNEVRQTRVSCNTLNIQKTKVVSILIDRKGDIWLGLFQKGLFTQKRYGDTFTSIGIKQRKDNEIGEACVMTLNKTTDGTLWVASDQDGIYHLDQDHKLIRHYAPTDAANSVPSTVLSIAEDADNRLWIGSYMQGFGWLDKATGEYHRASFSYGKSESVFDIRMDHKGRLWLGTLGDGVKCYDPKTDKLTTYNAKDGDNKKLHNNYILQMEMNHDRTKLFVGTATGLSCLDLKTGSWTNTFGKNVLFNGEAIRAICSSQKTGLWVGTPRGLHHVDLKTMQIRDYTTKDGLPNNNIASIEVDKNAKVWISTNSGLCRLDPKTGGVNCYYASDGLQGNEYSEGTSLIDRDGVMYFGGPLGVSICDINKISQKQKPSKIIITRMEMSGERVLSNMYSGSYRITSDAVSMANHFDFCHEDNNITIYFSTLTFDGTDHIRYKYSINGDNWVTLAPGVNSITMNRLAPGDYDFKVIAVDNGVESPVKEFTIIIHNPWYFTPFARFIYFMIIVALMLWYISNQKIKNKQKLVLQEHIHAEQLNEQRLQFFVNMSHEIRTPMTLIIAPLLQLIKDDKDAHRQGTYEIIKRNAERILHLVNQIMDIRKIDQNQMQLQMRETDIVAYISKEMTLFADQAKSRMINYKFIHEAEKLMVWIDRYQFDKVIINLLSNAFKYGNTGGEITITLTEKSNKAVITVYDKGERIPEESLGRIFERFYQSANNVNQTKAGTGVGLDLTKSLVELHHGEIEARNTDDGVEFTVTIPLGNLHLKPEEISPLTTEETDDTDLHIELLDSQAEEDNRESENTTELLKQPQSKRPTIVIVEDDDEIRNYLMAELSSTYRTLSYANGDEALPAILREIPQLVLSDIMMPGMDGTTLCAKVKGNVNTNHIPVILLTAKTRDEDRLEGLESGADLYLTKPFNMDIMRRSISNLLSTRKLMQNKFTGKEDLKEQVDEVQMETADEKLLTRIMAVINANLNNSDLNIDMICSEVGISRVHLHRKMKELTNQTPHDFIRNLRLKQAARLLSKKGQSITEVMYRCGFNSATSFSTMFKKMYGLSPRDYMKEHAGD